MGNKDTSLPEIPLSRGDDLHNLKYMDNAVSKWEMIENN